MARERVPWWVPRDPAAPTPIPNPRWRRLVKTTRIAFVSVVVVALLALAVFGLTKGGIRIYQAVVGGPSDSVHGHGLGKLTGPRTSPRIIGGGTTTSTTQPPSDGYSLIDSTGQIYGFGNEQSFSTSGSVTDGARPVAIAADPAGGLYVLEASGQVLNLDGAPQDRAIEGDATGSAIGMAVLPDGQGYMVVYSNGGIDLYGSVPQMDLTGQGGPTTTILPFGGAAFSDNSGTFLIAGQDGYFCYPSPACLLPSDPFPYNAGLVSLIAGWESGTYIGVTSSGGVYSIGVTLPNPPAQNGTQTIGAAEDSDHGGYWMVTPKGVVSSFGFAHTYGSAPAGASIVGIAGGDSGVEDGGNTGATGTTGTTGDTGDT
jgi:hypothetical protein